jgi:predicted CoA-binding protein
MRAGDMTDTDGDPTLDALRRILTEASTIAMVGASPNPERASNGIMKRLLATGYRVIPVNPNASEVLGERSYPSLLDVPDRIDIVDVFRRVEATPAIADDAVRIGAGVLWLQQGISSEEAARRARAGGLVVVLDRCIGQTLLELGIRRRGATATAT